MPRSVDTRLLTPADAAALRALRLRGLRDNPEAFGSTYAEEVDRSVESVAARLADPDAGFVVGVSLDSVDVLVGMAGCRRETGRKRRHLASVWGMYVVPEARGAGAGAALLKTVMARARTWDGVEQLTLTVVTENAAARRLYVSRGFRSFGLAPRALRDDGRYYDLEYLWLPLHEG